MNSCADSLQVSKAYAKMVEQEDRRIIIFLDHISISYLTTANCERSHGKKSGHSL